MNDFEKAPFWEVQDDEGPKLPDEGVYLGTVIWAEEGEYPGGPKMGRCGSASVTIRLDTLDGPKEVTDRFYNWPTVLWRISAICRAVGLKKHGEACRFKWTELMGRPLKVHIKHRSYTGRDGEQHIAATIDRYFDFDPEDFPVDPCRMDDAPTDGANPFDDDLPF